MKRRKLKAGNSKLQRRKKRVRQLLREKIRSKRRIRKVTLFLSLEDTELAALDEAAGEWQQ